jgi:hypothetical protein
LHILIRDFLIAGKNTIWKRDGIHMLTGGSGTPVFGEGSSF